MADLLEGDEEGKVRGFLLVISVAGTQVGPHLFSPIQDLSKLATKLRNAATEMTEVDAGCLDVWLTLRDSEYLLQRYHPVHYQL